MRMNSKLDASDTGAVMDDKGVVEVTRNPPDEEWWSQFVTQDKG
jgi:hypothetical protein